MQKRILVVRTSLLVKDKTKILFYTALTAVPEQPKVVNGHCEYIKTFLVSMRLGETPVPIPNTMVKPYTADDTALATVWKSRWTPDQIYSI